MINKIGIHLKLLLAGFYFLNKKQQYNHVTLKGTKKKKQTHTYPKAKF
jgi:hypothetical protein